MTTKLKENCNNLKCAIYKIKETLSGIVHFLVLKDCKEGGESELQKRLFSE